MNNPIPAPVSPFVVPSRDLIVRRASAKAPDTFHVEDVRDHLRKLSEKQDAEDHERAPSHLMVNFTDKIMRGNLLTPTGIDQNELRFSANGAAQMARHVLPSHFFKGLRELMAIDEHGEKLAGLAWNKFATQQKTPVRIRTVRYKEGEEVRRMIRSVHSTSYSCYSNLEYVQALLDNGGDFMRNAHVFDFTVTDDLMRLRVGSEKPTVGNPISMIELWNSEVGKKKVCLKAGMYKLICTNGMGHWDRSLEHSWIHRGNADRIKEAVDSAVQSALTEASSVIDMYNRALNTNIDDALIFMSNQMTNLGANSAEIERAGVALTDPTTTPGLNLASVVDAITLSAQTQDLERQSELENIAAVIMHRGVALAQNDKIKV